MRTTLPALAGMTVLASQIVVAAVPGDAAARPGIYTKAQATAGAKSFAMNCARCHGAMLQGVSGPPLKGPSAPIQGIRSVSWVYHFVSKQMPLDKPGSLSPATYTAIVAYIVQQNGHPAGPQPLTPAGAATSTQRI